MQHIKKAYGFDLGCSTCCTAFVDESNTQKVVNLHSVYSSNSAPSYVCYANKSDKTMVGGSALNRISDPKYSVVYNSKQFIGKTWDDLNKEKIKAYSFELVNKDNKPYYKVLYNKKETFLSAIDVTSEIIKEVNKITLNRVAGELIPPENINVVIGVPSAFDTKQRDEIISAAQKAGLKNINTICEQQAVALAYITLNRKEIEKKGDCRFLICDFGGNFFNASIVEYKNNDIRIIGSYGEDNIGGEEITKILEERVKKEILKETGINVNENKKLKVRVHQACEEVKKYLSDSDDYEMSIELDNDVEFTKNIKRKEFRSIIKQIFDKTINIIDILFEKRNLYINDVDFVICVGGSSRIPAFEEMLKKKVDKIPIMKNVSPDETVAIGCSIYANNKLKGKEIINLVDYIPPNPISYCISVGKDYLVSSFYNHYCNYVSVISTGGFNNLVKAEVYFAKKSDEIIYKNGKSRYSTVSDAMRYIGKKYDEIDKTELENKPYKLVEGEDGYCYYEVEYNNKIVKISPTKVESLLLKQVKEYSIPQIPDSKNYDENNFPVILTVPVDLKYNQIVELRKAAEMAGLKVERLIKEPVAAAFAYISNNEIRKDKCNILVTDFGENRFKSSIFNLDGNDMKIVSHSEDDSVSGIEMTRTLEKYIMEDIKKTMGIDIEKKTKLKRRLNHQCLEAIKNLLCTEVTCISVEIEDEEYECEISQMVLYHILKEFLKRAYGIINKSMDYGKIEYIDYIILIGEFSNHRCYTDYIENKFRGISILRSINPEEAFAIGGATYSHSYHDEKSFYYKINEVLLRSINIGVKNTKNPKVSYGIDLGTTYSSSAYVGIDSIIHVTNPNDGGNNSIPSCICYENKSNKKTFGLSAQRHPKLLKGEATLIYDSKRIIGKKYNEILTIKSYPFEIIEKDEYPYYKIQHDRKETILSPIEISSDLIKHIHEYSILQISHEKIDPSDVQVIIGVPAAFSRDQREATITAAENNHLYNVDLLSEPTAAALSYIYSDKMEMKECKILVYDFGGGTFDISVIKLKNKDVIVLGTFGDEHLGGEDITMKLEEYVKKDIKNEIGIDANHNEKYKLRIHKACEEAKISLSSEENFTFDIEIGDEKYEKTISRKEFNELCDDLFTRTIYKVKCSLNRLELNDSSIDYFILVGGSSLIPRIEELLKENFKMNKILKSYNTEEDVCKGCAVYSQSLINEEYSKYRINDQSSIYCEDGKKYSVDGYIINTLINRQIKLPYKTTKIVRVPKECDSIKIYQDELNSSSQFQIGELKIGEHENEEVEIEIEASVYGILTLTVNADGKKIESEIEYSI